MNDIIKAMMKLPEFFGLSGVSDDQISAAEQKLNTHFAPDYRAYLSAYGIASANGHEMTGICPSPRLNVVNVTKEMLSIHSGALADWYVIEQANIDGIVVWQTPDGVLYQTQPGMKATKLCSGLLDYLK